MRTLAVAALAATIAACSGTSTPPPTRSNGPKELRVLPDGVDGAALLGADAARAVASGAGPLRVLGADVAAEGDRIGAFVEIPDGECMLALTRSSPTIADVDLYAFEDDGSAFATDESPDPQAAILVCPPHPRRLYVVARVMNGSGILGVGVQSVPLAVADAVGRSVNARGRPGDESGRLDAWPGLEAKVHAHRAALGGKWEDVRRVALPLNARVATRVSATVDAGRCVDVFVVPSDELSSIDVVAEDDGGRIIARGRDLGRDRSVVVCAALRGQVSVSIRPRGSQGLAAVSVARTPPGGEAEIAQGVRVAHLSQTLDLDTAKKELARSMTGKEYAAAKTVASGTAKIGHRASTTIDLPDGCSRIDIVAGKPLVDVIATLWNDKGGAIAEASSGGGVALFACGKHASARLDLEAGTSAGPYAIELRKDDRAPSDLVAHPVAAARLLARLNSAGDVASAAAAKNAKVIALDASSLKTLPFAAPVNTCVEVVAALDDGVSGVDLRLVDVKTNEDALTHAESVAADRVCAGPVEVTGRIELRAASGKGDALVLTRTVAPDSK